MPKEISSYRWAFSAPQVNINDLEYIGEAEQPYAAKSASGSGKIRMSKSALVSTEINLIGMTVDEHRDIWTNIWTMLIACPCPQCPCCTRERYRSP